MIQAITKNRQSKEVLDKITEKVFGNEVKLAEYQEFTDGFCNVTYGLSLSNGNKAVLKIAPSPEIEMMACEVELMKTEVQAMLLARKCEIAGVPQVYFYDNTKTICNSDYFVMEMLDGQSYEHAKQTMANETQSRYKYEIGQWIYQLNQIKGEKFGHFCVKELQFMNWYDAFYSMMMRVIDDGLRKGVDFGITKKEIQNLLQANKKCFDEVTEPRLIHCDSWDGNVFVNDKKVIGMIDWERSLWAEGLMEDGFRLHSISADYNRGYGKEHFTKNEMIRCHWYDIYLYLIMMMEDAFRHYGNDGQYRWAKGMMEQVLIKLHELMQ